MALMIAVPSVVTADTGITGKQTISIIFSHDMHSHLEKFAKIGTVVKEKKNRIRLLLFWMAAIFLWERLTRRFINPRHQS